MMIGRARADRPLSWFNFGGHPLEPVYDLLRSSASGRWNQRIGNCVRTLPR